MPKLLTNVFSVIPYPNKNSFFVVPFAISKSLLLKISSVIKLVVWVKYTASLIDIIIYSINAGHLTKFFEYAITCTIIIIFQSCLSETEKIRAIIS